MGGNQSIAPDKEELANESSNVYTPDFGDVTILLVNILRCKHALPSDILIMAITDFASYCPRKKFKRSDDMRSGQNADEIYLTAPVPFIPGFRPSMVDVFVSSKDQGWSSYPAEQGVRNSSTWGELALVHDSATRCEVYRNIHAGTVYEDQRSSLGPQSALLKSLRSYYDSRGDFDGPMVSYVQLRIRSKYPGWENFVRHGSIEVVYELKDSIISQVEIICARLTAVRSAKK